LDEPEAQLIYQSLVAKRGPSTFINFTEAWLKFGGDGPLMEFVYLVTQGNTLRERLSEQVSRLEDDVRAGAIQPGELSLLRLIAVASAYEARLKVQPLASALGLTVPKRTFQLFEEEYLIRLSSDEVLVSGLHPIRSMLLVELLTDSAFDPWIASAIACLPLISAPDLEIFLLHSFSRRSDVADKLYQALLLFQPDEWVALVGVTHALIWLGISKYVRENQQAINEAFTESGSGWFVLLDYDIADSMPGTVESLRSLINSLAPLERQEKIARIQSYQTPKQAVFAYVREWLGRRSTEPSMPQTDIAWRGMAETLFWVGRLNVAWPLTEWFPRLFLESVTDILPIDVLADVVAGLYIGYPAYMEPWMEAHRSLLIKRFREETHTVLLQEDGDKITTHFLVALEHTQATHFDTRELIKTSKDRFHAEALVRIELMRKLFPDRQLYASQGYGHSAWITDLPSDSTQKTGIKRQSLPFFWLTSVNATFSGLGNYQFRPHTWHDFIATVINMRRDATAALQLLINNLERFFLSRNLFNIVEEITKDGFWDQCKNKLDKYPLLPASVIDEWGFLTESTSDSASSETQQRQTMIGRHGLAIQSYRPFVGAFRDYCNSLSNFFEQSVHTLVLNSNLGRAKGTAARVQIRNLAQQNGIREDGSRLSLFNLVETLKTLPRFQAEFHQLLGSFIDTLELSALEQQEIKVYQHIFELWHVFVNNPERVVPSVQGLRVQVPNALGAMRQGIARGLKACSTGSVNVRIASETLLWDNSRALWITIDGTDAIATYEALEKTVAAIRKGFQKTPDSPLRQHILNIYWPYIIVIPLVRGKSLLGGAWRWSIHAVIENQPFKQWQFMPHPIPTHILDTLNIAVLDDPRLKSAQLLSSNTTDLSFYAQHVQDFLRLPELDEMGVSQVQTYLSYARERMLNMLSSTLESLEDLKHLMTSVDGLIEPEGSNLAVINNSLAQLIERLNPQPQDQEADTFQLDLSNVAEWAERLEKARELAGIVYLAWASELMNLP
jgi:hypothetical protein